MTDTIWMLKNAGGDRRWMGLLGLSLVLGLFATPAAAGSTQHVQQAANYFALQPYDAEFIVLVDAAIRRAPSEEAESVATLVGGTRVKATARIAGAGWFRVSLESGENGFVEERFLRNADEDAATGGAESSGQVAALPRQDPVEIFQDCKGCPKMVRLDTGKYVMGSNGNELTEAPAHSVTIGYSFALGQHEVTIAEWMRCVAASACTYDPKATAESATNAVRNISWEDAQEYLRWLGQLTGKPYRLPSEAEWEYAARSGSTTSYWWGNEIMPGYADCEGCGDQWQKAAPAPVNKNRDNPMGFYGMAGGVAEWTADCWSRSYKNTPTDGSAHKRPGCKKRVLRGGSWRDDPERLRSSARKQHEVNIPSTRHGLRVALTLQ